jgi:hypothetical protein
VRSYWRDEVVARTTGFDHATARAFKGFVYGDIYLWNERVYPYASAIYQFRSRPVRDVATPRSRSILGFFWGNEYWGKDSRHIRYQFPFWPVVLATSATTFAVLPKPRLRFGLFNLLVLMSIVCISIGMIVAFVNSRGLYHGP